MWLVKLAALHFVLHTQVGTHALAFANQDHTAYPLSTELDLRVVFSIVV